MEAFTAGTLAGAGSFHCERCGYAIALHERDEIPSCPTCSSDSFARSSMFAVDDDRASWGAQEVERPEWLHAARDSLVTRGDYLAYDDGERVRVVPLQEGWTRLGRSLAAHVRFDDPTVSRRHALIHREGERDPRARRPQPERRLRERRARRLARARATTTRSTVGRFQLCFLVRQPGAARQRPRSRRQRVALAPDPGARSPARL